jgi:hypothetical protein
MNYHILTYLLATCCFSLPGLAAPDLSGKSPAEIAACEQSALAEATAATAQTAPTLIDRACIPVIGQTPA